MEAKVSIADIVFQLVADTINMENRAFQPFVYDGERLDYRIEFKKTGQLPLFLNKPQYQADGYRIYADNQDGYWRCFYENGCLEHYYAASHIQNGCNVCTVMYLEQGTRHVNHIHGAFYHIGLEQLLLKHKRLILHASCVDTVYGGLLFSGPSGIGKSTQGNLWCRHMGARLINGDRPIVGIGNESWKAYGSPYAGSSECYVNESVPIRAIIMLRQAPWCKIHRLSPLQSFQKILEQSTVNKWDKASMDEACALIEKMIMDIPVYEMECTPDEVAVECLRSALEEVNALK